VGDGVAAAAASITKRDSVVRLLFAMAAGVHESAAAALDQTAGHPAEEKKFAVAGEAETLVATYIELLRLLFYPGF
jgi:hypothetical protein